jgi:hypothetical protein
MFAGACSASAKLSAGASQDFATLESCFEGRPLYDYSSNSQHSRVLQVFFETRHANSIMSIRILRAALCKPQDALAGAMQNEQQPLWANGPPSASRLRRRYF